jgi:phage baseplate assembly protein gpV
MAVSLQTGADVAAEYPTLRFIIESLMSRLSTCTLVRVVACSNDGGLTPVGTVDVQPLVNQIDGEGVAWPHGRLYKLPYIRVQGGTNAIILDPKPNDIGLVCFASRDITSVKSDSGKAQAANPETRGLNPGSARKYDMSDGLYIGGLLNGAPEQYVQFNDDGIRIVSPTLVRVEAPEIELAAPTKVTVTSPDIALEGDVSVTGTVVAQGNVTGAGISLQTHTHSGVTPGGGTSGPPTP